MLILKIAMSRSGLIGIDGKLPWHIPADLAEFKRTTVGKKLICGYRTAATLPVLVDREVYVITRPDTELRDGHVSVLEEDLRTLAVSDEPYYFVGGAAVIDKYIDLVTEFDITIVDDSDISKVRVECARYETYLSDKAFDVIQTNIKHLQPNVVLDENKKLVCLNFKSRR